MSQRQAMMEKHLVCINEDGVIGARLALLYGQQQTEWHQRPSVVHPKRQDMKRAESEAYASDHI